MSMIKYDFGGEGHYENGVITVNINENTYPDIIADVRKDLEQYMDYDSVDQISAFHLLEHIPAMEIFPTLKYWRRFLKPTGRLLLVVPDIDKLIDDYFANLIDFEGAMSVIFNRTPYGRPMIYDQHYWGWSKATLIKALTVCGYYDIKEFGFEIYPASWTFDSPGMGDNPFWGKYEFPNLRLMAYKEKRNE